VIFWLSAVAGRSYWTWSILGFLIVCTQLLGVTEKLWVQVSLYYFIPGDSQKFISTQAWGEAYGNDTAPALFIMTSSVFTENEVLMSGYTPSHDYQQSGNSYFYVTSSSFLSFPLPDVYEHPLFYVGVYALIGFTGATISILATATQYTGALKASRSIFRQLLTGVVRATMRWHDITPAGRMLNRFGKVRLRDAIFTNC
jgi:ABC-type multidrug transport system fused ATPase/permease subunit